MQNDTPLLCTEFIGLFSALAASHWIIITAINKPHPYPQAARGDSILLQRSVWCLCVGHKLGELLNRCRLWTVWDQGTMTWIGARIPHSHDQRQFWEGGVWCWIEITTQSRSRAFLSTCTATGKCAQLWLTQARSAGWLSWNSTEAVSS